MTETADVVVVGGGVNGVSIAYALAARGAGLGVARRGGDQIGLDLQTALRFALHRGCSVVVGGSALTSRLSRILRSAWKTWARALSDEQSRLCPMAS